MEKELLAILEEIEHTVQWHPIENIRIQCIKRIVSMVCRSAKISKEIEDELRRAEHTYDVTHGKGV